LIVRPHRCACPYRFLCLKGGTLLTQNGSS
jgi:hypothetical protein